MTFKITEHIDFDQKGRAQCPVCLADGKNTKNLSLIPNTDGAYKCHRGCTSDDIRNAIGQPKSENSGDRIVPTALVEPKKQPKFHNQNTIDDNNKKLITESKLAKQWLLDRGIDDAAILAFKIGIAKKQIAKYEGKSIVEKKLLPCVTIPYRYQDGFLQKYFVAPWLSIQDRLDSRIIQDFGISARWFFTNQEKNKDLWICEGEWDAIVLACKAIGFDICTSTTGAGNIPNDLSDLDSYENIYIWYDLDEAGQKGGQKLQAKLGDRAKICTVPHPENPKLGYDITDAIKDGFTVDHFVEATKQAIAPGPTKTNKKSTLKSRLSTTSQLMARAKDYTDWLIDEILPINELILLAASPRAGKSLMAMNIAQCVASGTNFLDRPVTQGTVIYVQCEDSETKTKQRAIAQGWDENLPVYWLDKFKLSELPELIELAKELEPRLIVLDTLSRIRDDNSTESSAEMGRVLEPLQEFAKNFNCCILPIHHTGKIKADNADTLDIFDTIRGSSAIRATCRGTLVIAANETGYRLCVENGYNKQDLKVSLNLTDLTWKLLGKWGIQVDASQNDQVLDFLIRHEYATLEQIHEFTGINKGGLYKVLSRLVHDNKVSKSGSRKAVTYSKLTLKSTFPISDISDMSDMLSDSEIGSAQTSDAYQTKNNFTNTSHAIEVQKHTDVVSENPSNLSDCLTSASNQPVVSISVSDNISDKPKSVRYKELKVGDRVRIKAGSLSGKQAVIEALIPVFQSNSTKVSTYEARLVHPDFAIKPHIEISLLELVA
jgi:5S rRNA maturation endonuclease (ribonuclease M5)